MGIYSGLYKSSYSGAYRFSPSTSYTYLQFNGTDQYAEHAPFTPTGVNFTLSARYTPAAADIDSLVTLWGDGVLEKDASNNLVFNYTDTAAGSQSVTLSALALVADTEYLITASSDGNGISITVGSDTASNSAVIDPSTLIIESWMASAGAKLSAGIIRDVDFQDVSSIQNGTFLQADGTLGVNIGVVIPENDDFRIYFELAGFAPGAAFRLGGTSATWDYQIGWNAGADLRITLDGATFSFYGIGFNSNHFNTDEHYRVVISRLSSQLRAYINGKEANNFVTTDRAVYVDTLHRNNTFANPAGVVLSSVKIENLTGGDTYEYLLNNITDNGDGTGTAPNTGNTGSSFDGTVQNYDPLTDLVTIPNNTRHYPVATDGNIQPDTLNPGAGNATIVNFDPSMVQSS